VPKKSSKFFGTPVSEHTGAAPGLGAPMAQGGGCYLGRIGAVIIYAEMNDPTAGPRGV